MNLWELFSAGSKAYVVADSMQDAIALWPGWKGQGSGHVLAGPRAFGAEQGNQAVIVLGFLWPLSIRDSAGGGE